MRGYSRVCEGIRGYTRLYVGVRRSTRVYLGMRGYTWVFEGMRGYTRLCEGIDVYYDILTKRCEQTVGLCVAAGDSYWSVWNDGCNNIEISIFKLEMLDIF